jgi:hypothetical protein
MGNGFLNPHRGRISSGKDFQAVAGPEGASLSLAILLKAPRIGTLSYGDNLHVLRDCIAAESANLYYLDRRSTPPLQVPKRHTGEAQIEAFEDTWHWVTTEGVRPRPNSRHG